MNQNKFQAPANSLNRRFSLTSFDKYFLHSHQNMVELNSIVKNCNVDDLQCRFNIWRLCLRVTSSDSTIEEKKEQITKQRSEYLRKKQEVGHGDKKSPNKQIPKKNPLMMMGGNKAETKKQDSDDFLRQQIQKDVERTYQEMEFFLNKDILKLLSTILFVWCRRNPEISYKQGMNELLASVVVCYFQEAEFKHDKPEQVSEQLWSHHIFFNSVEHAEADIYSVVDKIFNIQGDMYKTDADQGIKNKVNPNSKNNTPILQRIIQIKDHKLKHMDMELFRILKLQDVQTKSFMLRWIRCMHTREFSLDNSFVIWDSIFLEYWESPISKAKGQFQFIDAMCLAMFIYMRSIVLVKETAGQILQVYQKYPPLKKGQYLDELIALAWTVCQQLRAQALNNIQNHTNWFQESDQVKNMGFMSKDQHKKAQKIQQSPVKAKKQKSTVQTELSQSLPSKPKNPIRLPQSQAPKPKIEAEPIPKDSIKPNHSENQKTRKQSNVQDQKQKQKYTITFQSTEILQIISNLNQSLAQTKDNNAINLIKKVKSQLEAKLKTQ